MRTFAALLLAMLLSATGYAADLYLAYNIWMPRGTGATCINYKVGPHIPAGTKVTRARLNTTETVSVFERENNFSDHISFKANGRTIYVHYEPRFHPGRSIKEYYTTMFTTEPLDQRVDDDKIKAAIRAGKVIVGMTKEQVIMSYGYPPEHKTPSLESNEWMYWRNKFGRKIICFDRNNLTNLCSIAKFETEGDL